MVLCFAAYLRRILRFLVSETLQGKGTSTWPIYGTGATPVLRIPTNLQRRPRIQTFRLATPPIFPQTAWDLDLFTTGTNATISNPDINSLPRPHIQYHSLISPAPRLPLRHPALHPPKPEPGLPPAVHTLLQHRHRRPILLPGTAAPAH